MSRQQRKKRNNQHEHTTKKTPQQVRRSPKTECQGFPNRGRNIALDMHVRSTTQRPREKKNERFHRARWGNGRNRGKQKETLNHSGGTSSRQGTNLYKVRATEQAEK